MDDLPRQRVLGDAIAVGAVGDGLVRARHCGIVKAVLNILGQFGHVSDGLPPTYDRRA